MVCYYIPSGMAKITWAGDTQWQQEHWQELSYMLGEI